MRKIGEKAKVTIVWNVKSRDYTKEGQKNIQTKFAKKYGINPSQIIVTANFLSADGKKMNLRDERAESVKDPKFQQILFKRYMEENKINDIDYEDIVKIDSTINSQINYDAYNHGKEYKLKWVEWSNFLSFGDGNSFDFTTKNGLILLNGEPANKSGKSTFAYELLHFWLFGKSNSGKAQKLEQYFNNYRPDCNKVKVKGCISINGEDYIINRELTRSDSTKKNRSVTNHVEYFKVLPGGIEQELTDIDNLQGESTTMTNKIIKESIGGEEDFDLLVSADSKSLDDLISIKDTERGRLLSRWTGLSIIEEKEFAAKERWKEISINRECDKYNRETLLQEISEIEDNIVNLDNEITRETQKTQILEQEIDKHKLQRDGLMQSKKPIDISIIGLDKHTLEVSIDKITESGKQMAQNYKNISGQIDAIGEVDIDTNERNNLIKENNKLSENLGVLRGKIEGIKLTIKNLKNSEYCPTCGKKFDNVDNSELIKNNEDKIKELTEQGINSKKRKDEITAILQSLETQYEQYQKKNKMMIEKSAMDVELGRLRNELKEKKKKLSLLNENSENIILNNNIDAQINVLDATIKTKEGIRQSSLFTIVSNQKDIETLKKNILEKRVCISRIEEELKVEKVWKLYLMMIGKNGIGKMVLNEILPIINGEINNLLSEAADFTIEISLNQKNEVEFWMVRDETYTRLSAASGCEKLMASLALRFVLSQRSSLSKPPFLILDEILGTVARENYDNVKRLYDQITPKYDFVLHITHLTDITDWHDGIVTIVKKNDISSIKGNE